MTQTSVNLPAPPTSWNQLSAKQLVAIHRLRRKVKNTEEYKLRALLMLLDLKVLKRADKLDDGTFSYKFRRKGLWPWLKREELSMCSWEAQYWINKYMGWLDDPFTRTLGAWEYKWVRGRKFRAPDSLLLNMTYQQFGNAQRQLVEAWNAAKIAEQLIESGGTRKAVKEQLARANEARAAFVSHLFISSRRQLLERKDDSTYLSLKKVYRYDQRTAHRHTRIFRKAKPELFDIAYQLFQSTLAHYKGMFPMLFKEHTDSNGKSALSIELETVNVIKRECCYDSQQAVYDANAVFIFEDLNMLATKAKQIEESNRKMKTKN